MIFAVGLAILLVYECRPARRHKARGRCGEEQETVELVSGCDAADSNSALRSDRSNSMSGTLQRGFELLVDLGEEEHKLVLPKAKLGSSPAALKRHILSHCHARLGRACLPPQWRDDDRFSTDKISVILVFESEGHASAKRPLTKETHARVCDATYLLIMPT